MGVSLTSLLRRKQRRGWEGHQQHGMEAGEAGSALQHGMAWQQQHEMAGASLLPLSSPPQTHMLVAVACSFRLAACCL